MGLLPSRKAATIRFGTGGHVLKKATDKVLQKT